MFGLNRVVTAKDFAHQTAGTLKVSSIWYSLQGEGPFIGVPCIFIRLTGCHLTCAFCDTWFDNGDVLEFSDIIATAQASVDQFNSEHGGKIRQLPNLFVITGGEPCLQPQLVSFIDYLYKSHGILVQIETTGTISVNFPYHTYVVCSPKISARGQPLKISDLMLNRINCMKCVISKTDPHYNKIPDFIFEWHDQHPDRAVYVSPMNIYLRQPVELESDGSLVGRNENERISFWDQGLLDHQTNQLNHEYAAELAMKHRFRLTLQSHLYAGLP